MNSSSIICVRNWTSVFFNLKSNAIKMDRSHPSFDLIAGQFIQILRMMASTAVLMMITIECINICREDADCYSLIIFVSDAPMDAIRLGTI